MELARRYMQGDCNEIQFNYIISTEKLDRSSVEELIEKFSYHDPVSTVAKLMIAYIMLHFASCLIYTPPPENPVPLGGGSIHSLIKCLQA